MAQWHGGLLGSDAQFGSVECHSLRGGTRERSQIGVLYSILTLLGNIVVALYRFQKFWLPRGSHHCSS